MKRIFLAFLILPFFLYSCAGGDAKPDPKVIEKNFEKSKSEQRNLELIQKSIELRSKYSAADYRIGAEDLLDIEVFQVEDLKTTARVSASGYIRLPLVGKAKAAGLTVLELETQLSERLERFLEEPVVSVFVLEYRSQKITVLGAVTSPQVYSVSGQKYLLDMISLAGGLTEEAKNLCIVQKVAATRVGGQEHLGTIVIDLDKLLIEGHAELNIPLSSGDIIVVPKGDLFFIDGAVNEPGSYTIKGKTTLIQAISMAKGFAYEADRSDIRIYRDTGKPERDIIKLNYTDVLEKKSSDVVIEDRDIVIVTKSGFKSFLKGLSTGLNLGLFSVGKGF